MIFKIWEFDLINLYFSGSYRKKTEKNGSRWTLQRHSNSWFMACLDHDLKQGIVVPPAPSPCFELAMMVTQDTNHSNPLEPFDLTGAPCAGLPSYEASLCAVSPSVVIERCPGGSCGKATRCAAKPLSTFLWLCVTNIPSHFPQCTAGLLWFNWCYSPSCAQHKLRQIPSLPMFPCPKFLYRCCSSQEQQKQSTPFQTVETSEV